MANRINFQVGVREFEIGTPVRANGAKITLQRSSWPEGPLFRWDVHERNRDGTLLPLAGADETGGFRPRRDGQPGETPLVIQLNWPIDKDKDLIRFTINVLQPFTSDVSLVWL